MKYISMKMEPKGMRPPAAEMTQGLRYHLRSGMGLGMRLTLRVAGVAGVAGGQWQRWLDCWPVGQRRMWDSCHHMLHWLP